MATQVEVIINHVNTVIENTIKPWIDKVTGIDRLLNGNGDGKGLKTKIAVMEKGMDAVCSDVSELKGKVEKVDEKIDQLQSRLLWGGVVVVILQFVLKYV